jgi:hypothetical protein
MYTITCTMHNVADAASITFDVTGHATEASAIKWVYATMRLLGYKAFVDFTVAGQARKPQAFDPARCVQS